LSRFLLPSFYTLDVTISLFLFTECWMWTWKNTKFIMYCT